MHTLQLYLKQFVDKLSLKKAQVQSIALMYYELCSISRNIIDDANHTALYTSSQKEIVA